MWGWPSLLQARTLFPPFFFSQSSPCQPNSARQRNPNIARFSKRRKSKPLSGEKRLFPLAFSQEKPAGGPSPPGVFETTWARGEWRLFPLAFSQEKPAGGPSPPGVLETTWAFRH